ncbi:MAG: hypothetical protein D6725_15610 [Planctomycetota bacterium]|nr:MAG: hypothetical protein D6725_15610 [Planctomycetota bacterium]
MRRLVDEVERAPTAARVVPAGDDVAARADGWHGPRMRRRGFVSPTMWSQRTESVERTVRKLSRETCFGRLEIEAGPRLYFRTSLPSGQARFSRHGGVRAAGRVLWLHDA